MISGVCHPVSAGALGQHGAARKRCGQENRVANTKSAGNTGKDGRSYVRRLDGTRVAVRFAAIQLGDFMRQLPFATALATLAATALGAAPAHAELVTPKNPAAIVAIVESQGWPAKLVTSSDADPYIESSRNGLKFLVLFMNCNDAHKECKTLQYYMGFNDAKNVPFEKFNSWNKEKRFARAYRDNEGDPVLEMDVDVDFAGLPRENLGESFNTWASLMDAYREFIYDD